MVSDRRNFVCLLLSESTFQPVSRSGHERFISRLVGQSLQHDTELTKDFSLLLQYSARR